MEELGIEFGQQAAQPGTGRQSEDDAEQHDHQHELQVVQPDSAVGVAQRLQHRDLPALRADLPRQHDVQQEHRDAQEHARQHQPEHAHFGDLLRDRLVRRLLGATVGTGRTVGFEQPVEPVDGCALGRAVRQPQCDAVERPFHVEGGGEAFAADPEDPEARVIADPVRCREDVLGRQHDADHFEPLAFAVQEREQRRPRLQSALVGEGLVHQHLVRLRHIDPATRHQCQPVHRRQAVLGQRDDAADRRLDDAGQIQQHVVAQRRRDLGHAGNLQQARRDARRHAACRSEHLCKARALVVVGLHALQRLVGRQRRAEGGDATRDHQRDRHHLAAQVPDIPHQLAVEHAHHWISSGESFFALRVTSAMRPSAMRSTRSAMPAIAALCVITAAVVPSS